MQLHKISRRTNNVLHVKFSFFKHIFYSWARSNWPLSCYGVPVKRLNIDCNVFVFLIKKKIDQMPGRSEIYIEFLRNTTLQPPENIISSFRIAKREKGSADA